MRIKNIIFIALTLNPMTTFAIQARESILKYFNCPQNSKACTALNDNMDRDTNRCRLSPYYIDTLPNYVAAHSGPSQFQIFDRLKHFGPITGKYSYIYNQVGAQKYLITAEVFFKNLKEFNETEINFMKDKFKRAAAIWNSYNPFGRTYEFKFQIANKSSFKTVSPRLVKYYTRGPYFSEWSTKWDEYTIAHEFGHVLGLIDEYEYIDNKNPNDDCSPGSIMCSSYYGVPQDYHYHLIYQRAFCEI